MKKAKPMTLLLIEDDSVERDKFQACADRRMDVVFVGKTGSSDEGIKFVKSFKPEGIILDLELHRGKGSGLEFLKILNQPENKIKPIIVVTTNTPSNLVYNHVRDLGVDIIFYKRQREYNPDSVIDTLLALQNTLLNDMDPDTPNDIQTTESQWERNERINKQIICELDFLGISLKYKGREYIEKAIFLLISKDIKSSDSVLYQVAEDAHVTYPSIIRAMQTAINNAWDRSDFNDLSKHYTARIDVRTGVPSPTDFIYYYADKIRKTL